MVSDKVPDILRLVTLLGAILVSLGSGTNYIYSAYSPQLGACLKVSYTQLNIIGLAGNMGVYISGPIWGRVADYKGPQILLTSASVFLLIGYLGIKNIYDDCVGDGSTVSTLRFALLVVCAFMTGLGGSAGLTAAMNTVAKSFPSSSRATTIALVMSGFGLSAFFFSLLAGTLFPGDISTLLLTLAIGTATSMLVGLLTVKPIPPPGLSTQNVSRTEDYNPILSEDGAITGEQRTGLGPSLDNEPDRDSTPLLLHEQESVSYRVLVSPSTDEVDAQESLHPERIAEDIETLPDIHGKRLWLTPDFYLIFTIMGICSGIGLMYINNVGTISNALYATTHPIYDEVEASKWQAAQVSTLSLGSFAARILIGLISDFTYIRLRIPRAYCFCIISLLFVISQLTAIAVSSVETLWIATFLVGLAYGSLWAGYPSVLIEWFGLAHFSENVGYICFSPIIGGNLFSLVFGHVLDTHDGTQDMRPSLWMRDRSLIMTPRELPSEQRCLDGKACYLGSLQVTLVACIISLGLSWWAGIRDGQKIRARNMHIRV